MDIIATDQAPAAIGPYSQAIRAGGMLYCSGQIGLVPGESDLVSGGVEAEARQALTNLKAVLEAGGSAMNQVVKATVFLKSMADFPQVNAIYQEFFGDHKPARACVAAAELPKAALFEVDAIATV